MILTIDAVLAMHGIGGGSGTAQPGDVLTGKTFTSNSGFKTGTMPDNGSPTWTPGTADQVLAAGRYTGGTVKGDPNLLATNILIGKTIFGVAGSAKRNASGTAPDGTSCAVSGLAFQPSVIVIDATRGASRERASYIAGSAGNAYAALDSATAVPMTWSVTTSGFTATFDVAVTAISWKAFE